MRVLLVKPAIRAEMTFNVSPPLGLGYLAAALRRAGHDVALLDCVCRGLDLAGFVTAARDWAPDVVGMSAYSHDLPWVRQALEAVRQELPRAWTLLGGPHATGMGGRVLEQCPAADLALAGEAESTLPRLLEALDGPRRALPEGVTGLPGVLFRGGPATVEPALESDLDAIPLPSWDLMPPAAYPEAPQGTFFRRRPIAPMLFTRGCPFSCAFCAGPAVAGRKLRRRSLEGIFGELSLLMTVHGVRELHILDDSFTLDRKLVQGFCEGVLSQGIDLAWGCPNGVRLDSLDAATLALMKRAGCYYVSVGIESGSNRILQAMGKGLELAQIRAQVALARSSGLQVNGFFILGYPGETEREIRATIDLSLELGLHRAMFFSFLPLPGTAAWRELESTGELEAPDWGGYFQASAPYAPRGMTRDQLKRLSREAYRRFYLRPVPALRLLASVRSAGQVRYILRRAAACL